MGDKRALAAARAVKPVVVSLEALSGEIAAFTCALAEFRAKYLLSVLLRETELAP